MFPHTHTAQRSPKKANIFCHGNAPPVVSTTDAAGNSTGTPSPPCLYRTPVTRPVSSVIKDVTSALVITDTFGAVFHRVGDDEIRYDAVNFVGIARATRGRGGGWTSSDGGSEECFVISASASRYSACTAVD